MRADGANTASSIAKQLGWSNVEVIDDDLGRSGGGIARPGFERLLATICDGRVGAVLAIEASRLARNGRDCSDGNPPLSFEAALRFPDRRQGGT
jgi:DNA invertase Pin-like site-specific DNA recombinase